MYITQASYKRACRYNVNCDAAFLTAVSAAFRPSKPTRVEVRSTFVATATLSEDVLSDKTQYRLLQRFFTQLSCFRLLPQSYRVELMRKAEFRIFRADEVLCHASDTHPKLFMVLTGKVCVHYSEPLEATRLRDYDETSHALSPSPMRRTATRATTMSAGKECEAPSEVTAMPSHGSVHVCALSAGEVFGEVGIRERALRQGATLFNSIKSGGPCSVLTLSYDDYAATLARYLEATEFTLDVAYGITASTLPQDRSCEQIGYVWGYLTRTCAARLFFNQLPLHTLNKICIHASIEKYAVGDDILEFIQREDAEVDSMRIVLSGCVCAFKKRSHHPVHPDKAPHQHSAPKPASLARVQSRFVRGSSKIVDVTAAHETGGSKHSQINSPAFDAQAVDAVGILPHGAAFGHHQIFTSSKSPYSYAAYSAESTDTCSSPIHHDTTTTSETESFVYLLTIPARFVQICFVNIDEEVVYNPVRILKQVTKEATRQPSLSRALLNHNLDRLFRLSACFQGIPRTRLDAAAASLEIAQVPARRIVYDVGESTKGVNFLVLSGHVRIFAISPAKARQHQQQQQMPEEKKLPKLLRKATRHNLELTHATLDKHASALFQCPFDRYAGDDIFLRDYDRTLELRTGDCFGRQVGGDDSHENHRKHSHSSLTRRASNLQQHQPGNGSETAVTMSECLIGSISLRRTSQAWTLTAKEKCEVAALIQTHEELDSSARTLSSEEINLNSLATSLKIVEVMRLGSHLTTAQRVRVANSLRYCRIKPGAVGAFLSHSSSVWSPATASDEAHLFDVAQHSLRARGRQPGDLLRHDRQDPPVSVMQSTEW